MEWVKTNGVNIRDYHQPHEFLKFYMMVKAKMMTPSDGVLNVEKGNTTENHTLKLGNIKRPKWK